MFIKWNYLIMDIFQDLQRIVIKKDRKYVKQHLYKTIFYKNSYFIVA